MLQAMARGVLASALIVTAAVPAGAQPARLRIPRVSGPPPLAEPAAASQAVDGRVDAFTQREPGDGVPASQRTVAYVSYDESHLYVVFVCEDAEPAAVRARLAAREAITGDDQVGVLLDTFHDRRRAY